MRVLILECNKRLSLLRKNYYCDRINNKERSKTGGGASAELEMSATDQVVAGSFVEEELHGIEESSTFPSTHPITMESRLFQKILFYM